MEALLWPCLFQLLEKVSVSKEAREDPHIFLLCTLEVGFSTQNITRKWESLWLILTNVCKICEIRHQFKTVAGNHGNKVGIMFTMARQRKQGGVDWMHGPEVQGRMTWLAFGLVPSPELLTACYRWLGTRTFIFIHYLVESKKIPS